MPFRPGLQAEAAELAGVPAASVISICSEWRACQAPKSGDFAWGCRRVCDGSRANATRPADGRAGRSMAGTDGAEAPRSSRGDGAERARADREDCRGIGGLLISRRLGTRMLLRVAVTRANLLRRAVGGFALQVFRLAAAFFFLVAAGHREAPFLSGAVLHAGSRRRSIASRHLARARPFRR